MKKKSLPKEKNRKLREISVKRKRSYYRIDCRTAPEQMSSAQDQVWVTSPMDNGAWSGSAGVRVQVADL